MLVAIAALSLAASQAEVPDADLACVTDRISPAMRREMLDEASSGKQGALRAAVQTAAAECAQERGWAPDAASWFEQMAAARMLVDEASDRLRANRVAPELVVGWFRSQTPEARLGFSGNDAESASVDEHLLAGGVSERQLEANFAPIGVLLAALHALERLEGSPRD